MNIIEFNRIRIAGRLSSYGVSIIAIDITVSPQGMIYQVVSDHKIRIYRLKMLRKNLCSDLDNNDISITINNNMITVGILINRQGLLNYQNIVCGQLMELAISQGG